MLTIHLDRLGCAVTNPQISEIEHDKRAGDVFFRVGLEVLISAHICQV